MIIVKLVGGLGNQMFQYAAGRALAIYNNEKLVLYTKGFEIGDGCTTRKFELDAFQIKAKIPTILAKKIKYVKHFEMTIIKRIKRKLKFKNKTIVYDDDTYKSISDISGIKKNIYLVGYFQSEKYFKDIRPILLKDFLPIKDLKLKHKEILKSIYESNSISIHIRRGDYADNPMVNQLFGLCSLDYYEKAVRKIKKIIKNPIFFIFSDDIEWVKNNLHISDQTKYISDNNIFQDYEEMHMMSHCKHNIIANSSFSWWGAWLNQNSEKIIIAPKKWFTNESLVNDDLIPTSWIKL